MNARQFQASSVSGTPVTTTAAPSSNSDPTVVGGLVSGEEYKKRQREQQQESSKPVVEVPKKKKKKKKKALRVNNLSFSVEEEEEESLERLTRKDPTIDTSFLPDADRKAQAQAERRKLEEEWHNKQQSLRQAPLDISYTYWDGSSGHKRQTIRLPVTDCTVGDFLQRVRSAELTQNTKATRIPDADALMLVKEDLILPADTNFYNLKSTNARGKSGPLANFGVTQDDIAMGPTDIRVEQAVSHPAKVVLRSWYESHKHIFPASRWEVYDPAKDYGKYRIGGGIVN